MTIEWNFILRLFIAGLLGGLIGFEREVRAKEAGISDWVLDPGFGFSKSNEDNQTLLDRLDELKSFRRPLLVGVSRKRFIWQTRGLTPDTCGDIVREYEARAAALGADIIRTHIM